VSQKPEQNYYPYFDYLRIVLASVVMFGHDGLISWGPSGALAVDVFFALSGWLIGGGLVKTEANNLTRFYFNRALRIWVPYYIALVLIIIASLLKDPVNAKWFEFIAYKATWVYNVFGPPQLQACRDCMPLDGAGNHLWSINAEEQFYLLSPLLLVLLPRHGKRIATWMLIVISFWLMDMYVPISLGVLAAILNSRYPGFHRGKISQAALLVFFISASVGLVSTESVQSVGYKIFAPVFAISLVLLLAISGEKKIVSTVLGGMSYPLYLNHWIGVFFFNLVLEPFGMRESEARNILSALMNYAIAAFLYWYIERNVLAMRQQLYSVRRGVVITILAYTSIVAGLTYGLFLDPSINIAIVLALFAAAGSVVYCAVINCHTKSKAIAKSNMADVSRIT